MEASLLASIRGAMGALRPATAHDEVGNLECAYSFDSPWSTGGLFVNLETFRGCGASFVAADCAKHGCVLYAHHEWTRAPVAAPSPCDADDSAPKALGVGVAGGFEEPKFDVVKRQSLAVVRGSQVIKVALPCGELPDFATTLCRAVLEHAGAAATQQQAWVVDDEPTRASKYADALPQVRGDRSRLSPDPKTWRCEFSGETENLWLNLSTGHVGGGRDSSQWGGPKGSGAALAHYEQTGRLYPLVVKLGTISAQGAEVYSYSADENCAVLDPKLAEHLAFWGIDCVRCEKTEKTTAELELDANAKFEWSAICESGSKLVPLSGPGRIGLVNLGNSCYLNSVAQLLASVPEIAHRYHGLIDDAESYGAAANHLLQQAPGDLATDHLAQMAKFVAALRCRRYAKPEAVLAATALAANCASAEERSSGPALTRVEATAEAAATVAPRSFRALFGRGHAEFGTGRQQDACEYLRHVLETLARHERGALADGRLAAAKSAADCEGAAAGVVIAEDAAELARRPTAALFGFQVVERTECRDSRQARYKTTPECVLELPVPRHLVDEARARQTAADETKRCEAAGDETVEKAPVEVPHADDADQNSPKRSRLSDDLEAAPSPSVTLAACLEAWAGEEEIADFHSSATGRRGLAKRTSRLGSFPRYLLLKVNRYYVSDSWEAKKLDVLVDVPARLDLTPLRAPPRCADEPLLPEEAPAAQVSPADVVPDEQIVQQLLSMGFAENGCRRACVATLNAGAEPAMEWVLSHMADADFAEPLAAPSPSPAAPAADAGAVAELASLGFSAQQCEGALRVCDGSKERAADWIFSHLDDLDQALALALGDAAAVDEPATAPAQAEPPDDGKPTYALVGLVSHVGKNTGCGHYVAHVEKDGHFVIFDDEKVARSEKPPLALGYFYLYARDA